MAKKRLAPDRYEVMMTVGGIPTPLETPFTTDWYPRAQGAVWEMAHRLKGEFHVLDRVTGEIVHSLHDGSWREKGGS